MQFNIFFSSIIDYLAVATIWGMLLIQNPKWHFTNGASRYKLSVIINLLFYCCRCVWWCKWLINCFILLRLTERRVKSDAKCCLLLDMTKLNSLAEIRINAIRRKLTMIIFSLSHQISILISLRTKLEGLYFCSWQMRAWLEFKL
jgi:hypothetical protein